MTGWIKPIWGAIGRFLRLRALSLTAGLGRVPHDIYKKAEHGLSMFDEDLVLKGLEQRKATLGAEYVAKNMAAADDVTQPFQEAMTAWC